MTAQCRLTLEVPKVSFWFAAIEITALFALILVYIWGVGEFCAPLTISILASGLASNAIRGQGCRALGFSWGTFPPSLRALWPAIVCTSGLLLGGGLAFHTVRCLPALTMLEGFLVYCLWATFQQYLLNGFLLHRLLEITGGRAQTYMLMVVAGIFSAVHAPNGFLMLVTLPAGYVSGLLYLRHRNLLVLGLAHALIGSLLYLVVPSSISHDLYVGPGCPSAW